jgi:transcriptional regulator with XRE-family HTH domain
MDIDYDLALRYIGKRVAMERDLRGWNQAQLAEHSGINKRMVQRAENGERAGGAVVLWRLLETLGVSYSEVIADAERRASQAG